MRDSNTFVEDAVAEPGGVSVVIPAHCDQATLDLCLAALAQQDYPHDLLEVVVVDHDSAEQLTAGPVVGDLDVRVLRVEEGWGPGAARRAGAEAATKETLLFIDVDIVAAPTMVREYVSVPQRDASAVGLGFRTFVDPALIDHDEMLAAIAGGTLGSFLADKQASEGQEWIESYLARTDDLREWRDDAWIVIVGAGISVSRRLYDYAGGFRDYPVHGVEDTEFGFRLFQSGATIVPNRAAIGYHLGLRTISRDRELINARRAGVLANEIPHPRYRPPLSGRLWTVPQVVCEVEVSDEVDVDTVRRTVDDLLGQDHGDLVVVLGATGIADDALLERWYAGDARVELRDRWTGGTRAVPLSSPFVLRVTAGVRFERDAVSRMLASIDQEPVGRLALVAGSDAVTADLWRTRVLGRMGFADPDAHSDLRTRFGERWVPASGFGVGGETGCSDVEVVGGRYRRVADA